MAVLGPAARQFQRLVADETGATMTEYALFVTLVSIGVGFLLQDIAAAIEELFSQAALKLDAVAADRQ